MTAVSETDDTENPALAPHIAIDILTEAGDWARLPEAQAIAERATRAALAAADADIPARAEVAITFTDNAHIRELNRAWREMDKPTNVLSFPAADLPEAALAEGIAQPLGDIIIALETLEAEAAEEDKKSAHHLAHLVVHGTLHLLGYDHIEDDEAEEMEGLERQILAGLGIDDPYRLPLDD
ncbi:rRNA maturation RNase YbeY [Xanthobacter sp. TB0139]|uniref:rRNA maturation RNase YbeY n=1 Tax=Xanthobacter sp. TB0139 TaxID=3459178 RepID=UPI00403A5F25